MSDQSSRPPGVVQQHRSSHRPIAAITACVLTSFSTGASAPYLTVSTPAPMRQESPPVVAAPIAAAVIKVVAPEDKPHWDLPHVLAPPVLPVVAAIPSAVSPGPKTTSLLTPAPAAEPKLEMVPDPVRGKPTRLEDILPYFVVPPAPASKATYEEK